MKIKKVVYTKENKFYWKSGDLHTQLGLVTEEELKTKQKVKNKDTEFIITNAGFLDNFEKLKRGPQIMLPKDIGPIITGTNLNKNSKVLEIGTGSGALTCFLSQFVKSIISYEIRPDHLTIAEKNLEDFEIKNVKLINKDAILGIKEKDFDAAIIDIKEPWLVIDNVEKVLKSSGYIVSYSPSITQSDLLVKQAEKNSNLKVIKTTETIEREWDIQGKVVHPKMRMLGHTAFLTFIRKL